MKVHISRRIFIDFEFHKPHPLTKNAAFEILSLKRISDSAAAEVWEKGGVGGEGKAGCRGRKGDWRGRKWGLERKDRGVGGKERGVGGNLQ